MDASDKEEKKKKCEGCPPAQEALVPAGKASRLLSEERSAKSTKSKGFHFHDQDQVKGLIEGCNFGDTSQRVGSISETLDDTLSDSIYPREQASLIPTSHQLLSLLVAYFARQIESNFSPGMKINGMEDVICDALVSLGLPMDASSMMAGKVSESVSHGKSIDKSILDILSMSKNSDPICKVDHSSKFANKSENFSAISTSVVDIIAQDSTTRKKIDHPPCELTMNSQHSESLLSEYEERIAKLEAQLLAMTSEQAKVAASDNMQVVTTVTTGADSTLLPKRKRRRKSGFIHSDSDLTERTGEKPESSPEQVDMTKALVDDEKSRVVAGNDDNTKSVAVSSQKHHHNVQVELGAVCAPRRAPISWNIGEAELRENAPPPGQASKATVTELAPRRTAVAFVV